jgi:NADH-quinone oxidoreductase subunit L
VTAFYSFRMYFLVFHGKERFATSAAAHGHAGDAHGHDAHGHDAQSHDDHDHGNHGHGGLPHESPWVITLPLVLLAIPSVLIGAFTIGPMLFGEVYKGVIYVDPQHGAMAELAKHFHGAGALALHAFQTLPFWLALAGVAAAYYCYLVNPALPEAIRRRFAVIHTLFENKYYLDRFNEVVFAGGARRLGGGLWKVGDQSIIDGAAVNGSARLVGWFAQLLRTVQSGYIYHYAIAMIVGVALFVWWFVPLLKR